MKYLASFLEENPAHSFKEGPTKPTKPPLESRNPYTKEPTKPTKPQPQVLEPPSRPPEPSEEYAARLRLAHEMGGIFEALPGAKRLKSGDWRFEGEVWEHDQAVLLAAHRRGITSNGCPLEVDAGELYRRAQAAQVLEAPAQEVF